MAKKKQSATPQPNAEKTPLLEEKRKFFSNIKNSAASLLNAKPTGTQLKAKSAGPTPNGGTAPAVRILNPKLKPAAPLISPGLKHEAKTFGKILLFAVPGIFVLAGALTGTDMLLHGRVMPGVHVGSNQGDAGSGQNTSSGTTTSANLGLLYGGDAGTVLQQTADQYLNTPLTVTVNGQQTQLTPKDLGVQFSLPQTLATLPTYDFRKDNLISLAFAAMEQRQAAPFMTLDSAVAQNVIEQKLGLSQYRAKDARISFDDNKNPTVTPESPGRVIDQNQLTAQLQQSIQNLQPAAISLNLIAENPGITAGELSAQKDAAVNALKTPLTLVYNDQKWKFDPSKYLDAVTFVQNPTVTFKNINLTLPIDLGENENQPPAATSKSNANLTIKNNPTLALDAAKMNDFIQTGIVSKIDRPTSDVKIYTAPTAAPASTPTPPPAPDKKIVIDGKGENGVKVSPQALLASLDLALTKNVTRVQVPAIETKANVTVSPDLQNLGIKNLLATGHTAFAGSHAGRIQNINVGISRYNGLLVKKGETFSFNDHLGPVDGQHGYVEELVIKPEGTVPDYGGGLCQVSSTIYQAALLAGFPIVERASHSYAVSYYAQILGYGLDGTIYPGSHDIKFINDTPADIIIQSYTDGVQAYFKFYGTDDGRKVWLEGPHMANYQAPGPEQIVQTTTIPAGTKKQVEVNHTGFDVTWYRYIAKNGKQTKETLFTRYDAVPAKIEVNNGTAQASVPKS